MKKLSDMAMIITGGGTGMRKANKKERAAIDRQVRSVKRKSEPRGTCLDYCEDKRRVRLYDDPRTPPLDTKPCLCRDCLTAALEQMLEENEGNVRHISEALAALRASERVYRDPQRQRLSAKEAQKGLEVVDCVMRCIVGAHDSFQARAFEAAVQLTRDELEMLQKAHAKDTLIINYIREDK